MGYSCAAWAGYVEDEISKFCRESTGSSNTWKDVDGETYFYERGREHPDGAVVGAIYRNTGEGFCRKVGSFHITPDGKIKSFPHLPKPIKVSAVRVAEESYLRRRQLGIYPGSNF